MEPQPELVLPATESQLHWQKLLGVLNRLADEMQGIADDLAAMRKDSSRWDRSAQSRERSE